MSKKSQGQVPKKKKKVQLWIFINYNFLNFGAQHVNGKFAKNIF